MNGTEDWQPFELSDEEAASYEALAEGLPPWMRESFWSWIKPNFQQQTSRTSTVMNLTKLRECERVCRFSTGYTGLSVSDGVNTLRNSLSEVQALRVADYLLSAETRTDAYRVTSLDDILTQAGSAYTIGERAGRMGLVRRVPEGVQIAKDSAVHTAGRAGLRLAEAWSKVFGIEPDPSAAYALAVRAVEDAAIPVVVPKQDGASLGHVIGKLASDGDWSLPLTREDPKAPTSGIVLSSCRALWKGHHDRHGGDPTAPMSVSQQEAETAVTLAVTLVQWFVSGMVERR